MLRAGAPTITAGRVTTTPLLVGARGRGDAAGIRGGYVGGGVLGARAEGVRIAGALGRAGVGTRWAGVAPVWRAARASLPCAGGAVGRSTPEPRGWLRAGGRGGGDACGGNTSGAGGIPGSAVNIPLSRRRCCAYEPSRPPAPVPAPSAIAPGNAGAEPGALA